MHTCMQTITLLISLALAKSLKFDVSGRPKCCSNSLTPRPRQPQDWADTLREATYRSITGHLDYSGTLDGRLDRDHTLWKLLHQAVFYPSPSNIDSESNSGVLVEKLNGKQVIFEFHNVEKSFSECSLGPCNLKNDSIVALWRVQKSDNPFTTWIQVKLPNIKEQPTEDLYEYNVRFGLKKLNPDPLQYNKFSTETPHRFSILKGKSSFKSEERMDMTFPKVFGIGRVTPTSFIYDHPTTPGQDEDGWIISTLRKPRPGVIVDTGVKNGKGTPFNLHSPFTASGPKGFHHIIHSLPSISPSQNLDHPSHNIRGFLPSIGPMNAPPPYKTEYVYDPRYVLYYNDRPDLPPRFPTQPPKQFKPSTEFVRYSEIDPFYHPHGERDMLSTTPLPFHPYHSTNFPKSINDQLPTNTPIENTRSPFQIIVGDVKPTTRTTTKKPSLINNILLTTEMPTSKVFSRPRTKTTEIPTTVEKVTTKPFGEKIKPKTSPSFSQTTPKTREKLTTKAFSVINKKKTTSNSIKKIKARNDTEPMDFMKQPINSIKGIKDEVENIDTSTFKDYVTIPTKPVDTTETIKKKSESTTVESDNETTHSISEAMNKDSEESGELLTKAIDEETTTYKTTLGITEETTLEIRPTESTTKHNSILRKKSETEFTTEDYSDETTEANNVIVTESQISGIGDFFSTLTDTLFPVQSTTEKTNGTTTVPAVQDTTMDNTDAVFQESKQHNYRLVTFPGDTVSIVANRISKSVSYRTADGKQGQLKPKEHTESRYRFSDAYKDYSTIL